MEDFMFGASSYYAQSKGLSAENEYQIFILKFADTFIALRDAGKYASVIGIVGTVASTILGYYPSYPLSMTAIGGCIWFGSSKIAQRLEPEAKKMLDHFKDLQKRKKLLFRCK